MINSYSFPIILHIAAEVFGQSREEIDPNVSIMQFGLDSLMIIKLGQEIENRFGVSLEMQWFFQTMPSLSALAEYVDSQSPAHETAPSLEEKQLPPPVVDNHPSLSPQPQAPATTTATAAGDESISLFTMQLETMRDIFHSQLRALGAPEVQQQQDTHMQLQKIVTPLPTPEVHSPAPAVVQPIPAEPLPKPKKPNIRGFVLEPQSLTEQQKNFVDGCVRRHLLRTAKSRELGRKSPVLADWKSTLSYRPELSAIAYPIVADTTKGSYFTDVDGNTYLDIAIGMGVHYLGHNPPYVDQALKRRIERGYGLGPQCDLTTEAAARVAKLTGCERVCFCNTGTEAVMFSLRLARSEEHTSDSSH